MTKSWKGKRVLIMGLGLHGGGAGAARFFSKNKAQVTVTDLRTNDILATSISELKEFPIKYRLGEHNEDDFINTDLIIQNPGVPSSSRFLQLAKKSGVQIETDMTIFVSLIKRNNIIGITGTKGKSTTASLVAHLLQQNDRRVELAGNIRRSVLDLVNNLAQNTTIVLELSSWQLEGLAKKKWSPHIAVITSIFEDHLNRYQSFDAYIDAKRHIVRFQTKDDIAILPTENAIAQSFSNDTKAQIISVTSDKTLSKYITLQGKHNILNVSLALATIQATGIEINNIKNSLKSFTPLEGRLEEVANKNNIRYINDTTATTPEATIRALQSFPKTAIALIAGGDDKNLPYEQLSKEIKQHSLLKSIILLPGTATNILATMLEKNGTPFILTKTMKEAVSHAKASLPKKGGIVLFSPASTSFAQWHNEFERGAEFKQCATI